MIDSHCLVNSVTDEKKQLCKQFGIFIFNSFSSRLVFHRENEIWSIKNTTKFIVKMAVSKGGWKQWSSS